MSRINLYLVEGDVEKRFLEDLRTNKIILPGRIEIFNVLKNDCRTNSKYKNTRYDEVTFVVDSDRVDSKDIDRIISNLKNINAKKVQLFVNTNDFEEELMYILNININVLSDIYSCKNLSKKEIKSKFINNSNNNVEVLMNNNADFSKMYSRKNEVINALVDRKMNSYLGDIKLFLKNLIKSK